MNKPLQGVSTVSLAIFIVILLLLVHPFGMAMPTMTEKILIGVAVFLFGVISVFFWREQGRDERALLHTCMVDRIAFMVCTGGLLLVVAYDVFTYMYDPRLIIILAITIIIKVIGHWHAERHL
jgi:hypothetical protein